MAPETRPPRDRVFRWRGAPFIPVCLVKERRARQPALHHLEQARAFLKVRDLFVLLAIEPADLSVLVIFGPEAVLHLQAEGGLDLAELFALETGGPVQEFAELEEIERRHRFQHIDLVIEQLPDFHDPLQAMDDHAHVRAVVVRRRFAQDFTAGHQLVQDLFKPKLVGLMHDNEEHLVVRDQFAFLEAERLLQLEKPINPEVIAVMLERVFFVIEWTFHRRTVAQSAARSQSRRGAAPLGNEQQQEIPRDGISANSRFPARHRDRCRHATA